MENMNSKLELDVYLIVNLLTRPLIENAQTVQKPVIIGVQLFKNIQLGDYYITQDWKFQKDQNILRYPDVASIIFLPLYPIAIAQGNWNSQHNQNISKLEIKKGMNEGYQNGHFGNSKFLMKQKMSMRSTL